MSKLTRGLVVAVGLLAILGLWSALTPGADNIHGPRYVLWKAGLFPLQADVVYQAMVGDDNRRALVVGLSLPELEDRFGRLRTRVEATPGYQKYYSDRFFLDQDIRWLGDSPWLVILVDGRAKELHLMKG